MLHWSLDLSVLQVLISTNQQVGSMVDRDPYIHPLLTGRGELVPYASIGALYAYNQMLFLSEL